MMEKKDIIEKEVLIEIENLTWGYKESPEFIYDKFSFKLYKWDFTVLKWVSGSGKTTLVKFLMRQIKPPYKKIFYKKEDIARFSNREVQIYRRRMWVIFQDFKLIDWKNVYDNISYTLEMRWEKKKRIKDMVEEALNKVQLQDRKDMTIPTLSWWEKQRVSIARAIVSRPEFIIADEPTGNLDFETAKIITDILIDLNKQWNTILFITHDMYLIKYMKTKLSKIREIEIWKKFN